MNRPIDTKQLGRLLDQYAGPLSMYASQWTRSPDDSVQEAFVALAGQIPVPENSVAWLYRVVKNRAQNDLRAGLRRMEREKKANQASSCNQDPSLQSEQKEERARLLGVLDGLQPDDRELIVLRIWSGLSWGEIGELTERSSSSAQRHYVAALEKMKNRLETECLTKQK